MSSTMENEYKFRFVSTNVIPKIFISAIALIIIILNASPVYSATCTPISAQLCAAVDDWSQIYINGNLVTNAALPTFPGVGGVGNDGFPYCDIGDASCTPMCISLNATQLGWLQATGNVISVRTLNTGYNELWTSYSLDVTCSGGQHSYVSSADVADIKMYYDSTCPDGDIPTYGGLDWYDLLYDWAGSGLPWVAPAFEDGLKYGKRIMDPQTGSLLPALSYSSDSDTVDNDCKEIFIRQGFDLPVEPTPEPPDFSITKSANPSTLIGQTPPSTVTFTLHICNTGGGTFGNPLSITDFWGDTTDDWRYIGPGDYTDTMLGLIDYVEINSKTARIDFVNGFPADTCYDYVFRVTINDQVNKPPTYCQVWHNVANLAYLAQPTEVATVTLTNYCPPPPNFSLVKSANPTVRTSGTNISYNLALCNTGGAAWNGTMTIQDDMSSTPAGPSWWIGSSTWIDNPATGIDYISISGYSAGLMTLTVDFQQPGFTGCVNIPLVMNTSGFACGTWFNKATLQSYFGSPTIVTTVDIVNQCSPTFTHTPTRTITPSRTMTLTRTSTPTHTITRTISAPTFTSTRTLTMTYTQTMTMTYTRTPQPTMDITKTANVSVATFGDTITYILSYHNTGSVTANPVCIYDTVPAQITYINSSVVPTTGAPFLSWCIGSVAPGGSGTITWWGRITAYPLNPLFEIKMYLGEIMIYKKEIITTYREYENQNLAFLSHVIRE